MDAIWIEVAPGFPPEVLGGAQVHADRVAKALEQRGYQVLKMDATRTDPNDIRDHAKAVVHLHVASDTLRTWLESLESHTPMLITLHDVTVACPQLFYARSIGKSCHANEAQRCPWCMHRKWLSAVGFYPFRRIGFEPSASFQDWQAFRRTLIKHATRKGVRWIFPSRYLAKMLKKNLSLHSISGIVLPNFPGVSRDRRHPQRIRVWGWAGALSPGKGIEDLLMGWEQCGSKLFPDGELWIWGQPAFGQRSWWEALWGRYRFTPGLVWKGTFSLEETETVIRSLDAIILPSKVAENCPLVVVDALALGRWVMGSDRGGLRELLPPPYRFPPSVEGVCEAFLRALDLPPPPWPEQVPDIDSYVDHLIRLAQEAKEDG